jgi:hypothetical protein
VTWPVAFACRHDRLIHFLRKAGYEVPDFDDPGPGVMFAIRVGDATECVRVPVVVDAELQAEHNAFMGKIEALPGEVTVALAQAVRDAEGRPESDRRHRLGIFVCHCEDPRAVELFRALCREIASEPPAIRPKYAIAAVHAYDAIVRVARACDYTVPDLREPGAGRMRAYLFVGGELIAHDIAVVNASDARRSEQPPEDTKAVCARLLEAKHGMLLRAAQTLLATPSGRLDLVIVLFATQTPTAEAIYGDLRTSTKVDVPEAMPERTCAVLAPYDRFMAVMRSRFPDAQGIDGTDLAPNHVRVAILVNGACLMQVLESTPLAPGGSA